MISNKRVSWKQLKCSWDGIGYIASDNFQKNRCGLITFKDVLKTIQKDIYQVIKVYIHNHYANLFVFICFICNDSALFCYSKEEKAIK